MADGPGTVELKRWIEEAVRAAESGDLRQLHVISEGLLSADPDVRIKAAAAAERIGSPGLVEPLADMALHDDQSPNRNQAIYALAGIGTAAVVPVLAEALNDPDPERREDARTALFRVLGGQVLPLFPDVDDEEGDTTGSTEASQLLRWWSDHSADFDDQLTYFLGRPASLARIVEEIKRRSPGVPDAYLEMLGDWTGQYFGREPLSEMLANWRRWLADHGGDYEAGRRYFHGHRLPDPPSR
jgi:hypothetical protein